MASQSRKTEKTRNHLSTKSKSADTINDVQEESQREGENHLTTVSESCRLKTSSSSQLSGELGNAPHSNHSRHLGASESHDQGRHQPNDDMNGYHMNNWCGLRTTTTNNGPSQGDDMENYFNENAHMLENIDPNQDDGICDTSPEWPNGTHHGLDFYENWLSNISSDNQAQADEGVEMLEPREIEICDSSQANMPYLSEEYLGGNSAFPRCDSNDSLYNHCEDDFYQMNVTTSFDDFSDFIETDMPKQPYGSSNSSRSRTPSDEDLPTLVLDARNRVTGAGDIQGALSLDWNLQYNIEHAQRPPSLPVVSKTSALSSDSSSNKPRTASDTDYGFYTPTSGASGSSLHAQSIQSPHLSESSATGGLTSTESSAFTSPEHERFTLPGNAPDYVRPKHSSTKSTELSSLHANNSMTYSSLSLDSGSNKKLTSNSTARPRSSEIDLDNLNRLSIKTSKEKMIERKVCNEDIARDPQNDRRRRFKGSGACSASSAFTRENYSFPGQSESSRTNLRFEHNNLNPSQSVHSNNRLVSSSSDQFNVSRQTSTSDFDQDENSFQEVVDLPAGLLGSHCPSCGEDDDNDETFQENSTRCQPSTSHSGSNKQCNCSQSSSSKTQASWPTERRHTHPNLLDMSDSHDPNRSSLDSLLQFIPIGDASSPGGSDGARSNSDEMEDIPLPPQTPILNRQWLKKAAKYLDYNFLNTGLLKEYDSDSDTDSEDPEQGSSAQTTDSERDLQHILGMDCYHRNKKKLYSVLLKDALLKHLQERSDLYASKDCDDADVKKVMLWSEYQAYVLQVSQIGTSACGATAVINVLKYFDMYIDQEKVCEAIRTNLRAETAPIGEYLLSRCVAGTTGEQLIEGVENLTEGAICGRFFPMFPEREINLRQWLGEWMERGAVPVVTLNRQRAVPRGWVVPDAWHHQMVYGVGPKGVYLTNPLEIVPEYVIQCQLCSESVLLVRRNDVVSRWHDDCNLGILLQQEDPQWQDMNVLGQVVNVLRQDRAPRLGTQCPQLTTHITIPAWYRSGITLFVRRDTEAHALLLAMPENLPLKCSQNHAEENSSAGSSFQQLFAEEAGDINEQVPQASSSSSERNTAYSNNHAEERVQRTVATNDDDENARNESSDVSEFSSRVMRGRSSNNGSFEQNEEY